MASLNIVRFSPYLPSFYYDNLGDLSAAALGGKGAGLITMTKAGLPVPQGFIFGVAWCHAYQVDPAKTMKLVKDRLQGEIEWLSEQANLSVSFQMPLVSVRSGAPISMPGMMDTILNVGLVTKTMGFWQDKLGPRAAADCYRRLIQMMGITAYDIDGKLFEHNLGSVKHSAGVKDDKDLSLEHLQAVIGMHIGSFEAQTKQKFPNTIEDQLLVSIETVFKSWNSDRAKVYRKLNNIPDDLGTAVTVQRMVFGNLGSTSGTGVMFTRDPNTGEKKTLIEYLDNAQGEDVVAGIRTPYVPTDKKLLQQLLCVSDMLEEHYNDMVDLEFTVEECKLWILQSRNGKRQARAALKIAFDLLAENKINNGDLPKRIKPDHIRQLLKPALDPSFKKAPVATGIPASGGFAQGEVVLTAEAAINCRSNGKPCILVRLETSPDDIGGMAAAAGVLTAQGGSTAHAAVVARGMNKPCVTGCQELKFEASGAWLPAGTYLQEGAKVAIDGDTGRVWRDVDLPVVEPDMAILKELGSYLQQGMADRGYLVDVGNVIGALDSDALVKAQEQNQIHIFDMSSPIDHYSASDNEFSDMCGTLKDMMNQHIQQGKGVLLSAKSNGHLTVQPVGLGIKSIIGENKKVNVGEYLFGTHTDSVYLSQDSLSEIGGYANLTQISKALGRKLPPLIRAVPLEYALFSVLQD